MSIYINRALNLKHVKMIGFDMDHTLVAYNSDQFEEMAFYEMIRKLILHKNYPKECASFQFDFKRAIRGLVFDISRGNLIKLNLYSKVKSCCHGTVPLIDKQIRDTYMEKVIDLRDSNYMSIDTTFSISIGLLYSLLIDLRDGYSSSSNWNLSYAQIFSDMLEMLDRSHQDDSLKGEVRKNLKKFVKIEPKTLNVLKEFKKSGKLLSIITNSDYHYTKLLLDYAINGIDPNEKWTDLFDYVITLADKPSFFFEKKKRFLKVDLKTGLLENWNKPLEHGVYQGGCAGEFTKQLSLSGGEILYLGDHIFGDIVKLKKTCDWRTALVIEDLADEVLAHHKGGELSNHMDELLEKKDKVEGELLKQQAKGTKLKTDKEAEQLEGDNDPNAKSNNDLRRELWKLETEIRDCKKDYDQLFNAYWGSIMRAGFEESYFAGQVERYACIYMDSIASFHDYSPRHFFRPKRRALAHEL